MKNTLWIILFVNLLAVATALGYVIAKPGEVRGVLANPNAFVAQAPAVDSLPERRPTRSPGAAASETDSAGSAEDTNSRVPTRKPRPRRNADGTEEEVATEATFLGPTFTPPTDTPPAPELYPFDVDRRTFPNEREMEVELIVRNSSGYFWKSARVLMRSTGHNQGQVFQVNNWGIDQLARFRYRFPKNEYETRITNLRIIEVSGSKPESAMVEDLGARRAALAGELDTEDAALAAMNRSGGALSDDPEVAANPHLYNPLAVELPTDGLNAEEVPSFDSSTDDRAEALQLMKTAHTATVETQKKLQQLAETFREHGYKPTLEEHGGEKLIEEVRGYVADFEAAGLRLNELSASSRDEEIVKQEDVLSAYAESLLKWIEQMETQVRVVDPKFTVME